MIIAYDRSNLDGRLAIKGRKVSASIGNLPLSFFTGYEEDRLAAD
jgi:hypothetical protein